MPKTLLPPEASVGYQVRRCHRMFDRMLTFHLSPHDLNSGFWYYLRVLWMQDGLTQKELSDLTNVAENTTVTMISLMVERGLVQRTRDAEDRRKLRVYLTPRGRKLESELMHYAFEINSTASARITRQEIDQCLSVLRRVADNLQQALSRARGTSVATVENPAPPPRRLTHRRTRSA